MGRMRQRDQGLSQRAAAMRHNATPFEVMLWRHLSRSQLGGHKFRRQAVIGQYIVDFFCPAKNLAVEVDGDTHNSARDTVRDTMLANAGVRTIRISNAEVAQNIDGVMFAISAVLDQQPDRWPIPHPNPSPEGEGLKP